jgi:hypothetical protein
VLNFQTELINKILTNNRNFSTKSLINLYNIFFKFSVIFAEYYRIVIFYVNLLAICCLVYEGFSKHDKLLNVLQHNS